MKNRLKGALLRWQYVYHSLNHQWFLSLLPVLTSGDFPRFFPYYLTAFVFAAQETA